MQNFRISFMGRDSLDRIRDRMKRGLRVERRRMKISQKNCSICENIERSIKSSSL